VAAVGQPEKYDYISPTPPDFSLVITRNFGNSADDQQTFMPIRFLRGLIPDVLLNDYVFWQNANDDLVGYQKPELQEKTQNAYPCLMFETKDFS
jgi:hypothetical protein